MKPTFNAIDPTAVKRHAYQVELGRQRMEGRPRDKRGFPIPYVQFVYPDGEPDFRVLDTDRRIECLERRICGLCGQQLGYWIWFVGGPLVEKNLRGVEPPFHRECAEFALSVCPYWVHGMKMISDEEAMKRTRKRHDRLGEKTVMLSVHKEVKVDERPEYAVLLRTREFKLLPDGLIKIARPVEIVHLAPWKDKEDGILPGS